MKTKGFMIYDHYIYNFVKIPVFVRFIRWWK